MVEIIPAIIPRDYADLEAHIGMVKELVPRVQIDVIDGIYAPEASWPYNGRDAEAFAHVTSEDEGLPFWELLDFEIDMMVAKPEEKLDDWISAGATTLIIHIESTSELDQIFARGVERGVGIALALKPSTLIDVLEPWVEKAAFIQCMGNDQIGRHGVLLDESILGKIQNIKERFSSATIGVDIGVTEETASALVKAGASRLASGAAIFENIDIKGAIERLSSAAT